MDMRAMSPRVAVDGAVHLERFQSAACGNQ